MLGRFLELGLRTPDIAVSVAFWESLGFTQCRTSDAWSHPYGVVTDGRLHVGLHQAPIASPALTFSRARIAAVLPELAGLGIETDYARTGDDSFNEIGLRDPAGQALRILEARTWFAGERASIATSACGWFEEYSVPCTDFAAPRGFWEALGFVALEESDTPWPRQVMTGDGISIALHRARTQDLPMLVFSAADMPQRLARLRERGIATSDAGLPRGLDPRRNALLESPEGVGLLLMSEVE
jgi:hypothetical protein